jgi:hypothetical protein
MVGNQTTPEKGRGEVTQENNHFYEGEILKESGVCVRLVLFLLTQTHTQARTQ